MDGGTAFKNSIGISAVKKAGSIGISAVGKAGFSV